MDPVLTVSTFGNFHCLRTETVLKKHCVRTSHKVSLDPIFCVFLNTLYLLLFFSQVDDYKQARHYDNLKKYVSKMIGETDEKKEVLEEEESKVKKYEACYDYVV